MLFVFLILIARLLANVPSQKREAPKGPVLLWRQPYRDTGFSGGTVLFTGPEGALFARCTDGDASETLCMLDADTGALRWTWNTQFEAPEMLQRCSRQTPAVYNQALFLSTGKGIYTLQLQNGSTMMKKHLAFSSHFRQIGSSVLCVCNRQDARVAQIMLVDMCSGKQTLLYQMQEQNQLLAQVLAATCQREPNGDTLLYWTYQRLSPEDGAQQNWLFGYNLSQKRLLFSQAQVMEDPNPYAPVLYEDLVLLESKNRLTAVNRYTGLLQWQSAKSGSDWQQIQLCGPYLVLTDALNGRIMAFQPDSGARVWETELGGACSLPQELDGILYTVNQDNGRMYALRLYDGTPLWQMESPDLYAPPYAGFCFALGMDRTRRRLYVSSYLAAYCYQLDP
ncbi:MAG: PQQ-binding-like beta-propeller repeat protein [Bacteroidetes bacterium]|nr:PQQ-binding-like beta-propeller repeat protein [Bacteroidota bacterium]